MEFVQQCCGIRENEAEFLKHKCIKLLKENIIEISCFAELYPCDMMRSAVDCLDYNVHKITDYIVRKYAEHLADYVREPVELKICVKQVFNIQCKTTLHLRWNEEHIKVGNKGGTQIMVIAKILGSIIGVVLYPLFWILEWILLFIVTIFEAIDNLMADDK